MKPITTLEQYFEKSAGWMSHLGAGALGAGLGVGGTLAAQHYMNRTPPTPDATLSAGLADEAMGGSDSVWGSLLGGLASGAAQATAKDLLPRMWRGGRVMAAGDPDAVFSSVAKNDELLAGADRKSLQTSFETMRRFAPTLATDPNAVRAYLREAATSGSGVNYNTIKLLADAEKAVNYNAG